MRSEQECACRKELGEIYGQVVVRIPPSEIVMVRVENSARAALATPCGCAGLREAVESANGIVRFLQVKIEENNATYRAELAATYKKLDDEVVAGEKRCAELAAANERAEWAEECGKNAVELAAYERVAIVDRAEQAERQRDIAQAGWREAVEVLRKICVKQQFDYAKPMKDGSAIVARFDAQGGKDAE